MVALVSGVHLAVYQWFSESGPGASDFWITWYLVNYSLPPKSMAAAKETAAGQLCTRKTLSLAWGAATNSKNSTIC
jgi:hypothetical protein